MNDTIDADFVIEMRGGARTFEGNVPVRALSDASFDVRRGEHVAIVGASGSGKSTLLNVVGLLDRLTEGSYTLCGEDVSSLDERARNRVRARTIGFVFQAFHLLPYRSVLENVELGELYAGLPRQGRAARAADALAQVGMEHRLRFDPRQLSGGEQQRVAVARALVARPEFLLCDEPTGNLDTRNSEALLDLLDEQRRQGLTILVITHDVDVARRADRVLCLTDGAVTEGRS